MKKNTEVAELHAVMRAEGLTTARIGDTLFVGKHSVTVSPNGNVNLDHNPVAKTSDNPFRTARLLKERLS